MGNGMEIPIDPHMFTDGPGDAQRRDTPEVIAKISDRDRCGFANKL